MPVTRAKKLYKLKEEDLAGLRVAVKLNPVNHLYKHMRLFPCSDLERAAERKSLLPQVVRAPRKVKSASSKPVQEQQASASQAPSQSEEVQPLAPAQPALPEPGVPLTKIQQVNMRNMCIIADSVAPGACPIATLADHARTRIEPMDLVDLQQFAAVALHYRQQQQLPH